VPAANTVTGVSDEGPEVASIAAPKSEGGLGLLELGRYAGAENRIKAVKNALRDFCNMILQAQGQPTVDNVRLPGILTPGPPVGCLSHTR
jgi:hypothetical protein